MYTGTADKKTSDMNNLNNVFCVYGYLSSIIYFYCEIVSFNDIKYINLTIILSYIYL